MGSVGKRIKDLRNSIGMSQVEFADKIGVSKQTLYKYENDIITNIPSDKIEAAAKLCGASPAALMGWTDSPVANSEKHASFRDDEQKLLKNYNQLNSYGKEKAFEYIEDLAGNVKYTEEKSLDSEGVG